MENEQHALMEFFARLASIPSVEELREGERLLLLEDLAGISWRPQLTPETSEEERERLDKEKAAFQQAVRKNDLWPPILEKVHQQARALLWGLLDGQTVLTPSVTLPRQPFRLDREGRIDAGPGPKGIKMQGVSDRLMMELLALLRPYQSFPFRRCPVCQNIFVPVKRQKFCSPNCTYKSVESKRKEEKREYMRTYMANRRKRMKKTRQKGKEK